MRTYEHGGNVFNRADVRLDFSVNLNPLGMPQAVKDAIVGGVDSFDAYPDPFCRSLCARIAQQERVPKECILCGNGAADLLFRVCFALRPKTSAVFTPAFSEYARSASLSGGRVVQISLARENGFALTQETVEAVPDGAQMVFLCNPNNPNGALANPGMVEALANRCRAIGATLLIDESFLPFTCGVSSVPLMERYPNVLVLRSFTKLYAMAGVRLGYLVCAGEPLLEPIEQMAQVWSVSSVAQMAGLAALCGEPAWSEQARALVQRERETMTAFLTGAGLRVYPSDANFLLIESDVPLYRQLKENGILVRDCSNFTGLNERFVRIGLKTPEENRELRKAITEAMQT